MSLKAAGCRCGGGGRAAAALAAVALIAACSMVGLVHGQQDDRVTAVTEAGKLTGYRVKSQEGRDVNVFIGVPFARPPAGELRFKRPEPLPASAADAEVDALTKKPMCPQIPMKMPGIELDNAENDDDCLYMNVFASATGGVADKKRPVMVYFYGGFFQWGDNNLGLYDGVEFAAETDAIIIFPAYRVGMFGFLNSTTAAAPGNQGLFDQLMALKFVQRNVAAFGGDANQVTIAGQSAGAISSSVHTSSPASKGLFRRALLLSGAANTLAFFNEAHGQSLLFSIANFLDCFDNDRAIADQYDSMASCLAAKERPELLGRVAKLEGGDALGFGPGRDGEIIAGNIRRPTTLDYNVEEVMIGTTAADGELIVHQVLGVEPAFEDLGRNSGPDVAFRLALRQMFGISNVEAAKIYSAYISDEETDKGFDYVVKKAPRMITDVSFDCPTKFYLNSIEKVNQEKTKLFRYVVDGPRSKVFVDSIGDGPATHIDDVMLFLGIALNKEIKRPWEPRNPPALQDTLNAYTEADRKLAKEILQTVKAFMTNGNPSVPGQSAPWPLYSELNPSVVHLAPSNVSVTVGSVSQLCHLWAPYTIDGDIKDIYDAPTTTTTTQKPVFRQAKVVTKGGRKLSKSRHSKEYSAGATALGDTTATLLAAATAVLALHANRRLAVGF